MRDFSDIKSDYDNARSAAERMDAITSLLEVRAAEFSKPTTFLMNVLRDDRDPIVRHEAAFVLGDWRAKQLIADEPAASSLCKVVEGDPSAVARHEAAEALRWFGGANVDRALDAAANDPVEDVRLTVAMTIAKRDRLYQTYG
ncbi:HEAT repeat domain-containing protein [Bradyrhizobium sp. 14AA]